jgi:hypothetical protein
MKYKDWCYWAKTPGKQLNISIFLAAIAFSGFIYTYYASLTWDLVVASIIMGTFLMLSIFYISYALIICFFMIKYYYFKK